MTSKGKVSDRILISFPRTPVWYSVQWRVFSLLLLLYNVAGQETVQPDRSPRIRTVSTDEDFFQVVMSKDVDVIRLREDMNIRNYYGWVLPSSSAERVEMRGSLKIEPVPRFSGRRKIDLDGNPIEQMISGIVEFTAERIHFTRMMTSESYDKDGYRPHLNLKDCIVEAFLEESSNVSAIWKGVMPDVSTIDPGTWMWVENPWCLENYGLECLKGGVYFGDSSVTFKNDQQPEEEKSTWTVQNTLIILMRFASERVSSANVLSLAVGMERDIIQIPHDFELLYNVCGKFDIRTDTLIQDALRSYPPSIIIDFNRIDRCMKIEGPETVRVKDLVLRGLLYHKQWPDMFPFLIGNQSTIILENVIVEMDVDQSYHQGKLKDMMSTLRGYPALDMGLGYQLVDEWTPEDCIEYQRSSRKCREENKCSPEATCPGGAIYVEDASFVLGDSFGIGKSGTKFHVIHSLFTVIGPFPSASPPTSVVSNEATLRPSNSDPRGPNFLSPLLIAVIVVLVLIIAICTFCAIIHRRQLDVVIKKNSLNSEDFVVGKKSTVHGSGDPNGKWSQELSNQWSGSSPPPPVRSDVREDREYQIAANKLLGSVTLGPLLGMGSFGRVYKGTWNGATCAVKVISHARGNSAEVFADREAGISTDLHHPNIVQTFIKTTRTFNSSNSTKSEGMSSPGSLGTPPLESAHSSIDSVGDEKEAGYVEISKLSQQPKRANDSSFNQAGSNGSQDNDNWDSMSAISVAMETWLVQEWCDMGSLDRLVERKMFLVDSNQLDMVKIVDTCLDICRGMIYLKNKNVIHGDLKTSNVLVSGCLHERKGFTAKVADFGLSRQLSLDASHIKTRTTGTVTHMPPELFKEERLTTASDVYSFGILMWELVAGTSPLIGVPHFVVMKKILLDNWRPTFPEGSPECYEILAKKCWDSSASERPSFEIIMTLLLDMRAHFARLDPGHPRLG